MLSAILRFAISLACLAPRLPAQEAPEVQPARHATCVRYYSLEGDVKPDLLRRAVAGLSSMDHEAKIALGPVGVSSRPKSRFVALELPTGTAAKDVEKALRKVTPKTIELAWTAFQGKDRELPSILGYSGPECVVGMDNDMRWFALENGRARFFYVAGKLDEKELRARFTTLYKPFGGDELGELEHERIEWKLAEPLEPPAAKAAEKAVAKIRGIAKARVDPAARTLSADVVHDGLLGAVAPAGAEAKPAATGLPGGGFLPDEVLDALAAAKAPVEGAK
jgi:hypothetical protein